MKKVRLALLAMIFSGVIYAQEVVSTQGESYYGGSANIDFTIGEAIINTETDGTYEITQGFHQTNWNFAGMEDLMPEMDVKIFPNPTSDILNITTTQFEGVSYALVDANGKIVKDDKLIGETTIVGVNELAPGSYSILLLDQEKNKLKTFKLIKNQ